MDPRRLRNRVLRKLLTAPAVIVPLLLGAASMVVGLQAGEVFGTFGLIGVAGILLGIGLAASRWARHGDRLVAEARDELARQSLRLRRADLRRLKHRLRQDGDPRTGRLVDELTRLHDRLPGAGAQERGAEEDVLLGLRATAERLYASCFASLERAADQHEAARRMATEEYRERLLSARGQLLDEVQRSIEHLGATLDHLHAAALRGPAEGEELARLRDELERGLEVARRVEQRMEEFDRELRGRELKD